MSDLDARIAFSAPTITQVRTALAAEQRRNLLEIIDDHHGHTDISPIRLTFRTSVSSGRFGMRAG